jgi:cell division protein FtsB
MAHQNKFLVYFRKLILNKYTIAIIVFLVAIIFISDYNLRIRWKSGNNIKKLKKEIQYYKDEIESNKNKMNDINADDESLEQYGREKYFFKKDNEDVFILNEDEY